VKPRLDTTEVSTRSGSPALREVRLRLEVVSGPDRGLECDATRRRVSVGSQEDNDLHLTDSQVSRRHFEVSVVGEKYVIRDLGSTNGTRVNGTEVLEAVLAPGALIQVGRTEVVFRPSERWIRVQPSAQESFGDLVGRSQVMRDLFGMLAAVAPSDLSVVICGETGSGKEMAARAIHAASRRAHAPFVTVDCGAISPTLIESELFGHERGAFTGADRPRVGALRAADSGTLFLDEIAELPVSLQPKLLRAIERREVKPLGGDAEVGIDVRIVAATHRDLAEWVHKGSFREDLYFRIAEVMLVMPPLRTQREDIEPIAATLLAREGVEPARFLTPALLAELRAHDWPGNVRELRNYLRRLVVHVASGVAGHPPPSAYATKPAGGPRVDTALPLKQARKGWSDPLEKQYLERILDEAGGDLSAASKAAGMHRKSFERLLRQHGLWRPGMGRR
jgi:DNA-binding NtrC family response regulator